MVDRRGKYCRQCHNAYMREWRKTHGPTDEDIRKGKVRARTRYLVKKGVIKKESCDVCADSTVQAHHPDYSKPELVIWLCPTHHHDLHKVSA